MTRADVMMEILHFAFCSIQDVKEVQGFFREHLYMKHIFRSSQTVLGVLQAVTKNSM
jgi:hypothetical protein